MTDTDVALYELTETYQQILNNSGIHPYTLSSSRPVDGMKIEIISGYWDRGYDCSINGFVETLKEGKEIQRASDQPVVFVPLL